MKLYDKNIYYNLLVNIDLLKYLENRDKRELSLTCKNIFELTHKLRLSQLDLSLYFFIEIGYGNPDMPSDLEDVRSKQQYCLDLYIKKRKLYTKKLTVEPQLNYSIITHVICNLSNLTCLYLNIIIIPKQSMQQILDSLPFLNILHLDKVIISLPTSNELSYNLKFPKYLRDLKLDSCRQFNSDITDAMALKNRYFSMNTNQLSTMDISTMDVSHESLIKLHQITLQDAKNSPIIAFNQLLGNLTHLKRYNTIFSCMNNDSLSIISRKSNLTALSFDFFYYELPSSITNFIKLPYIKVLNFAPIIAQKYETVKNLIKCCSNLESLKYYWTTEINLYEILYVEKFPKLKKLIIISYLDSKKTLSLSTHRLNLEYIEIYRHDPLHVDISSIISSLPKLRRIKINLLNKFVDDYESIQHKFQQYPGWRVIFHPNSIDLRKI